MTLGKSVFYEARDYPDRVVDLYDELVSRHDHLRESLHIYQYLLNQKISSKEKYYTSLRIRESILWFMTTEFYSRFISNYQARSGSKRSMSKLVSLMESPTIQIKYDDFLKNNSEVLSYITTQRMKFFSHADNIDFDKFPKVFENEYKEVFDGIADILDEVGNHICTRRIASRNVKIGRIFDLT